MFIITQSADIKNLDIQSVLCWFLKLEMSQLIALECLPEVCPLYENWWRSRKKKWIDGVQSILINSLFWGTWVLAKWLSGLKPLNDAQGLKE